MKRLIACLGVGAMLLALFTAPLFHFHEQDDHGRHAPRVHAHFFESEAPGHHHPDNEFEGPHSHDQARFVEFFTYNAPSAAFELATNTTETFAVSLVAERQDILISAVPRAHGPPGARRSAPRSPPSI